MNWFRAVVLWGLTAFCLGPAAAQQECSVREYCTQIESCAEAVYRLNVCGDTARDRDNDGIPCENLCGKTKATMAARMKAQPYTPASRVAPATLLSSDAITPAFACAGKRTCRQMLSCAEARFYLNKCGLQRIDGNRDGVPCSGLCRKP